MSQKVANSKILWYGVSDLETEIKYKEDIMSFSFSNIKWVWVILGELLALVIAYGSSICVVTGYAAFLGFQVRGTPDQALINEFAGSNAGIITSLFVVLGTLLGGLLAGRKAELDKAQNGLLVGIITAVIFLLLGISGDFSIWSIVGVVLALVGGWLGGRIAAR